MKRCSEESGVEVSEFTEDKKVVNGEFQCWGFQCWWFDSEGILKRGIGDGSRVRATIGGKLEHQRMGVPADRCQKYQQHHGLNFMTSISGVYREDNTVSSSSNAAMSSSLPPTPAE